LRFRPSACRRGLRPSPFSSGLKGAAPHVSPSPEDAPDPRAAAQSAHATRHRAATASALRPPLPGPSPGPVPRQFPKGNQMIRTTLAAVLLAALPMQSAWAEALTAF
jgi:hypothetical protein